MDEVAHEDITLYHYDNKVSLPIYKDKLQKGVVAPSHVIIYAADKALRICFAVILKNHTQLQLISIEYTLRLIDGTLVTRQKLVNMRGIGDILQLLFIS